MLLILLLAVFSQVFAHVKIEGFPISASFEPLKPGSTIVDRDRERFRSRFRKHHKRTQNISLKNTGLGYKLKVGFGSPPVYYNLQLDIGSSYTWIRGEEYIRKSETSIEQREQLFMIPYLSGRVFGRCYKDLVTLSPSLSIPNMEFGVASDVDAIDASVEGILGLGPAALSLYVIIPKPDGPVPAITDALLAQNKIQRSMFGVSFAPTTSQGVVNGILNLGETDRRKYTGKLNWVDVTKHEIWSQFWGFEQTIKHGKQTIQPFSVGTVDTGTTLIYIRPQAFEAYYRSIPGSKIDESNGLLEIPEASLEKMKDMSFVINGVSYELTPNAQLWPRALNTLIRADKNKYYSVINVLGKNELDQGTNFIIGYVFLQRFYTAYDVSKSKIGFAYTSSAYDNAK